MLEQNTKCNRKQNSTDMWQKSSKNLLRMPILTLD